MSSFSVFLKPTTARIEGECFLQGAVNAVPPDSNPFAEISGYTTREKNSIS